MMSWSYWRRKAKHEWAEEAKKTEMQMRNALRDCACWAKAQLLRILKRHGYEGVMEPRILHASAPNDSFRPEVALQVPGIHQVGDLS